MGCFYCEEHNQDREALMIKVGEMKGGVLHLFRDQTHKGRCVLALKGHKKEFFECSDQERADLSEDLARASKAIKELWGCDTINIGSFGDTNPHLHFPIGPKYQDGPEFGGVFQMNFPDPVRFSEEEYQEMVSALREKLGL